MPKRDPADTYSVPTTSQRSSTAFLAEKNHKDFFRKKHRTRKNSSVRPILTTHLIFLLFFFLSLILHFSCLRFFSDLRL